jgi:hypothetical protein
MPRCEHRATPDSEPCGIETNWWHHAGSRTFALCKDHLPKPFWLEPIWMKPRKPKPWSAGKEAEMFPSLHGLPAHEPKPLPGTVTPMPSTGVVMSPRVAVLADKSGNANDLTQADPELQPTIERPPTDDHS